MHVGEILVTALIGFAIVGVAGYLLGLYNGLVALKNNIGRSWANIDVLLKQRHDELPKLVKTCEGYMQHERAVFDKLSEARGALANAKSVGQRAEAEGVLSRALGQFFAVAENYPVLKADQSFLQLQSRISEIENKLSTAEIIDTSRLASNGRVVFGASVELEDQDDGGRVKYQIVGEDEAEIRAGRVSITSPIARALVGKSPGDVVDVSAPGGIKSYEVVSVRYE